MARKVLQELVVTEWEQTGLLMDHLEGCSMAAGRVLDVAEGLQPEMDHLDPPYLASSFDRSRETRQQAEACPYQQVDIPVASRARLAAATEAAQAVAIAGQEVVAVAIAAAEEVMRRTVVLKMAKPERVRVTSLFVRKLDMDH